MSSSPIFLALATVAAVGVALIFTSSRRREGIPLPPGPRPKLFLGNLLDISPRAPWLKWTEWAQEYGDVVYLRIPGQHILVLSSLEACDDLLVKRGANYSHRPHSTMADLCGWNESVVLQSRSDRVRAMRRLGVSLTSPRQVLSHVPLVERMTHEFLRKISATQEGHDIRASIQWLTGGALLKILFGYTPSGVDDEFIRNGEVALDVFSNATSPGWVVDIIPALRRLPHWIPVVVFLQQVLEWKKATDALFDAPFNWVQQKMAAGEDIPDGLAAKLLHHGQDTETQKMIKYTLGSFYAGGTTTINAQHTFFFAMTRHPEIQRRAQAEIDSLTEGLRLPNNEDRLKLPYVSALVKEVLRWNPVTPGGIPRACGAEDQYRGWRIPTGSMVIYNVWHLAHDSAHYPDPFTFNPDRHLGPIAPPDPASFVFGFGRRECPGRHLADTILFLTIANTLAIFDIKRKTNENGAEIVPELRNYDGSISRPIPFPFQISPRSEKALAMLRSMD